FINIQNLSLNVFSLLSELKGHFLQTFNLSVETIVCSSLNIILALCALINLFQLTTKNNLILFKILLNLFIILLLYIYNHFVIVLCNIPPFNILFCFTGI